MQELQVKIKWLHRLEKQFTKEWLDLLENKWYPVDKVSDWSIWTKKVDCYIFTDVSSYICEIKVIASDIFKISKLRDNQYSFLKRNLKLNWKPIVTVYSKKYNDYKIIPFEFIVSKDRNDRIKLQFN